MWLLCELRPLFRAHTHVSKGSWHVRCSRVLHGPLSLNLSLRELAFPPKPASPLPCLTPARNWGASLLWSSTPPESSLPSCPFRFLNHLISDSAFSLPSGPRPQGHQALGMTSHLPPRLVPAGASLGWELLGGLPGEWAASACPAVALRVAVASSAGPRVGNTPYPPLQTFCAWGPMA